MVHAVLARFALNVHRYYNMFRCYLSAPCWGFAHPWALRVVTFIFTLVRSLYMSIFLWVDPLTHGVALRCNDVRERLIGFFQDRIAITFRTGVSFVWFILLLGGSNLWVDSDVWLIRQVIIDRLVAVILDSNQLVIHVIEYLLLLLDQTEVLP